VVDLGDAEEVAGHPPGGHRRGVAALAPDGVGRVGADPEDLDAARDVGGALVPLAQGQLALGDELGDEREVGRVCA
jgi:hypothetical protein